eukprot:GHVN01026783.1.p1 GENE.GHVN01026783.1~~GHVN01026783.1.p1  ORF type:complete len:136 (+),score=20.74 GHVN01026783.1:410-817(+)
MSTIHQLHERCNDLEAELRERQGKAQLVAAIRARPSMEGVLEEFLEFEENPTEHDIAGWLGFGALGFHAKIDILLYAVGQFHPEQRIYLAKEVLEKKHIRLTSDLKVVRAGMSLNEPAGLMAHEDLLGEFTQKPP